MASDSPASDLPTGHERDARLWRAKREATPTSEGFVAARACFKELTGDAAWGLWRRNRAGTQGPGSREARCGRERVR